MPLPTEPRLIVVADKDRAVQRTLQRVLTRARFRVAFPESSDRALELCADRDVALLIVDGRWAGEPASTAAVVNQLRSDLPVLCIGDDCRPLRGADDVWLAKPFASGALLDAIHSLLGPTQGPKGPDRNEAR